MPKSVVLLHNAILKTEKKTFGKFTLTFKNLLLLCLFFEKEILTLNETFWCTSSYEPKLSRLTKIVFLLTDLFLNGVTSVARTWGRPTPGTSRRLRPLSAPCWDWLPVSSHHHLSGWSRRQPQVHVHDHARLRPPHAMGVRPSNSQGARPQFRCETAA